MKRRKKNTISVMILICIVLACAAAALAMLAISDRKQKEKIAQAAGAIEALEKETQESQAETTPEPTETPTPTPTETPSPTPTETPTPEPTPMYLTDLNGMAAGDPVDPASIDAEHLEQYFTSSEIVEGDEIYDRILYKSYRPNNDIGLSQLRYLKLLHYDFDHEIRVGELIVNAELDQDFLEIFTELYRQEYEIRKMHLIDKYWTGEGNETDTVSIEDDNTSAFCYRSVTGGGSLSNHAFGRAIDLNPLENPYVVFRNGGASCAHQASYDYIYNRSSDTPHVITPDDLAYKLFTEHGFSWGGAWSNPVDYQHFEKKY